MWPGVWSAGVRWFRAGGRRRSAPGAPEAARSGLSLPPPRGARRPLSDAGPFVSAPGGPSLSRGAAARGRVVAVVGSQLSVLRPGRPELVLCRGGWTGEPRRRPCACGTSPEPGGAPAPALAPEFRISSGPSLGGQSLKRCADRGLKREPAGPAAPGAGWRGSQAAQGQAWLVSLLPLSPSRVPECDLEKRVSVLSTHLSPPVACGGAAGLRGGRGSARRPWVGAWAGKPASRSGSIVRQRAERRRCRCHQQAGRPRTRTQDLKTHCPVSGL